MLSLFTGLNISAQSVQVPNYSFEAPTVPSSVPALPFFEAWQHTPKPDWYVEDPNAPETQWANLAGLFPNPVAGQPGHIDNLDQSQAGYLFAAPSNGIFQDLSATYEVARAYTVTAGLVGSSSIPPTDGTTLAISLYYRDATNQMVTIASTNVAYNSSNFPTNTSFIDFSTSTPVAKLSDPWARHGFVARRKRLV
jgi:hypothetical protein